MALLKSISGIRGTIGGKAGENLTPEDIVTSAAAYGTWLLHSGVAPLVVMGRDARPSGQLVTELVAAALQGLGIDVVDLGLATTPTVEMAVPHLGAGGGIILTASHNPREWNALKLLNQKGEFISAADGQRLLRLLQDGDITYAGVDNLGSRYLREGLLDYHIEKIFEHPLVNVDAIRSRGFRVALDAVNSVGALAIPTLVEALGGTCAVLNGELNGQFAHNPEPLPQHLGDLTDLLAKQDLDLGVAVDPDVDRLALVGPGGRWIGEEYTLVTVADYVLQHRPGPTVSNLSSSRALRDLTHRYGQEYHATKVGEVNVVAKMKAVDAVIGGEGNGGIIDPALHYGRDSLIGLALVLSYLATSGKTINDLRDSYPNYEMVKDRVALQPRLDVAAKLSAVEEAFANDAEVNKLDGLKLDFPEGWVHLRSSNTEPIVRIYAEATSTPAAQQLVKKVRSVFEA